MHYKRRYRFLLESVDSWAVFNISRNEKVIGKLIRIGKSGICYAIRNNRNDTLSYIFPACARLNYRDDKDFTAWLEQKLNEKYKNKHFFVNEF